MQLKKQLKRLVQSIQNFHSINFLVSLVLAFLFGGIMRNTKQYGLVSSWQEHQMLVRAQHTYEKLHSKHKPTYSKSVSAFSLDNSKRRCGEMT
jgi:hypothetical protein